MGSERCGWTPSALNRRTKECAKQVLRMREIYGRAAQVVVWIGETSVDARASFAVL